MAFMAPIECLTIFSGLDYALKIVCVSSTELIAEDTMSQAIAIIFQVFGGLGIFLLGMKNMSDGMQAVAGEKMRKLIGLATNNRLLGEILTKIALSIH